MVNLRTMNINHLFETDDEELEEVQSENKGAIEVKISDLIPFSNHPFKLYKGNRLDDMVESIKEHGIITPLIVRPMENDKYEILSGHNRANAGKLAGLETVPVVVKEDLTDEEAMLIVTETNLIQRAFSELSHSEKARILAERHEAEKRWGKNSSKINEIEMMSNIDGYEENSEVGQIDPQGKTRDIIADKYDLSPSAVSRYIRINRLNDGLKERVDKEDIPFMSGVDLSFLKEDEQEIVEGILDDYGYKVDLKKSDILKSYSKGRNFNYDKAYEVLSGKFFNKPKKNKKPKFTLKFTKNIFNKYFPANHNVKEVEELIENLLEQHFNQNIQNNNSQQKQIE